MLSRPSDVYSWSACFVSSIACKKQTLSHRNVEKDEKREMIFTTTYIQDPGREAEGQRHYAGKGKRERGDEDRSC